MIYSMPPSKANDFRVTFRLSAVEHHALEALSEGKVSTYTRVVIQNHIKEMLERNLKNA